MTLPSLYLITDAERVGSSRMLEVLAAATRAGLGMVQIREKGATPADLEDLLSRMRACAPDDTLWILNRNVELVEPLGAHGSHLGGALECVLEAREKLGPEALIGYSAHAPGEVSRAFDFGASYVSYSPVFEPISKKGGASPPVGLEALRACCDASPGPVYALGGVDVGTVSRVWSCGVHGVAVIGAIVDAVDPEFATRELLESGKVGR